MNRYKYHRHIFYPGMSAKEYFGLYEEIHQWCEEMFGKDIERWDHLIDGFNFNDEKDYALFLLRWA